jgi:hypothetical protein
MGVLPSYRLESAGDSAKKRKNSLEDPMTSRNALLRNLKPTVLLATVGILLIGVPGQALADGWFKVAAGMSGMAMDDINNGDFRFYDYTADGFNLSTLDSGFSFSLHGGVGFSSNMALGLSWERQHAHTEGTDVDVTAKLKLDADFFMLHYYWIPLQAGSWEFGAAAGLGLIFPTGTLDITGDNNVNYGEGKISGSSDMAYEIMLLADWKFGGSTSLELTAGYRVGVLDDVKLDSAPVVKEDGTPLELDYTGYTLKAGFKFMFGGEGGGDLN